MKFKTKVAYSAVLATLSLAAGTAQAAYLSEQGTGQVLLYPYYTVQGGMDTYVSVTNTTSRGKAVKVRFIEGRGSWEVLDFNLYLSAYDVWNAAVTAVDAADANSAAKIVTGDNSCTSPMIPAGGQAFRNGAYIGKTKVGQDQLSTDLTGLARTREGYVEIIEMGVTDNTTKVNGTNPLMPLTFEESITHSTSGANAGKPADCAWVNAQFGTLAGNALAPNTLRTTTRTGGLIGTGTLISVKDGLDYTYDPVAIEDFNSISTVNLHFIPGSTSPSLADAEPTSVVIDGTGSGRRMIVTDWSAATPYVRNDPISAVLQRSAVYNEYTVNTNLAAATDWVVTFPTKRAYVGNSDANTARPFTKGSPYGVVPSQYTEVWKACEPISLEIWDREELKKQGSVDFSPAPVTGNALCYEANVLSFGGKNVLGSVNLKNNIADVFQDGWARLTFANNQAMTGPDFDAPYTERTYYGLPTIGFAVQKYVNGTFNGSVGNYGGSFIHKYARTVAP